MEFNLSLRFGKKKSDPAPAEEPKQNVTVVNDRPSVEQFEQNYGEMIRRVFAEENEKYANIPGDKSVEMPIQTSGRTSVYEGARGFMLNDNTPVPTNFDFNNLKLLANMGMYNRHVSMAIENIVSLGNTDYDIDFGEGVGSKQAAEMRKFIWSQVKNWYEFADGEDSLDNDLLVQLATYGTISAEACIMPNLKGISKIVRVDPYYIRFAYDKAKDSHIPLQQIGGIDNNTLKGRYPGYIELNTATYSYIAMRRMGEMPYAVPPFLSALEDLFTESDMIKNLQNMMRRLGMMGFLSVLLKAPVQGNDTAQAYQIRLQAYLDSVRGPIERGLSRGVAIGFKDTHEFKLEGTTLNSGNAENLMKMVKGLVFSGLKQDPNMHGENYATTETFGRVVMEKMTAQVINFQKPVATFKARAFALSLMFQGYRFKECNVKYHRPSTHDDKREQEVRKMKQDNLRADYQDGLISQEQRANMLGYDAPAEKEPRKTAEEKILEKTAAKASKDSKALERVKKKLKSVPEFKYDIPEGCRDMISLSDDEIDPTLLALIISYLKSIQRLYSRAIESTFSRLLRDFSKLSTSTSLEQVQNTMLVGLLDNWENTYLPQVQKSVEKNMTKLYSKFRKDASIISGGNAPKASLDLFDTRAIEFLKEMDNIYLGKFIGDSDTQNRIRRWIKEQYDAGNVPLGGKSKDARRFINEFSDLVEKESWKIDRIISTSSSLARNIASINYMFQADVEIYTIHEYNDHVTCRYCLHMDGMQFSVSKTREQFDELFTNGIQELDKFKPFASKYNIDEFVKLDATTLQTLYISLPPFHPSCRGWCTSE